VEGQRVRQSPDPKNNTHGHERAEGFKSVCGNVASERWRNGADSFQRGQPARVLERPKSASDEFYREPAASRRRLSHTGSPQAHFRFKPFRF